MYLEIEGEEKMKIDRRRNKSIRAILQDQAVDRTCLRCSQSFKSVSRGNRICLKCKNHKEYGNGSLASRCMVDVSGHEEVVYTSY